MLVEERKKQETAFSCQINVNYDVRAPRLCYLFIIAPFEAN